MTDQYVKKPRSAKIEASCKMLAALTAGLINSYLDDTRNPKLVNRFFLPTPHFFYQALAMDFRRAASLHSQPEGGGSTG